MKRTLTSLAAAAAVLAAGAPAAAAEVVEIGTSTVRAAPSCPRPCFAVGRVTGYQTYQAGSRREPFRALRAGKVVAFSVALGKPNASQVSKFNEFFGGPPKARISILRRGASNRHRLMAQSYAYKLAPFLGSTPTFAIHQPLSVARGDIIALTVPTWAPALAVGRPRSEAWLSSRAAGSCDDAAQKAMHLGVGSTRAYGCRYRTGRLRYSATFVPNPRPTR